MRVINRAADRMLTALVPKITAYGCTPGTHTYFCYCRLIGNEFYGRFTQVCTCSGNGSTLYCKPCVQTGVCS